MTGKKMDAQAAFDAFDKDLELNPRERDKAIRTHNEMTDALRKDGLISGAILQGSFARKTMIKPLRDIDKLMFLPKDRFDELDRAGGPEDVMNEIEKALRSRYPDVEWPDRSRHALKMDFGANTFDFDIVPAFDTDGDDVLIADRDATQAPFWISSNTRTLIKTISKRNQECGGQFIRQARMLKQLAKNQLVHVDLPGLHVETLAFHLIDEELDHDVACLRFLEGAGKLLRDGYRDPTDQEQLSDRIAESDRARAADRFDELYVIAEEAYLLSQEGKDREAVEGWHGVLGDPFPLPPARSVKSILASSATAKGITRTGVPTSSASVAQRSGATRSWRR